MFEYAKTFYQTANYLRDKTLQDFIRDPSISHMVCNGQKYMLGAKNLVDFYFVGINEEFETGVKIFFNMIKKGEARYRVPHENVTPNKKLRYIIDECVKAEIRKINEIDIELYNNAKKKFLELKRHYL